MTLISCYQLLNSLLCISRSWFTSVIRFSISVLVWDRFCCSMSSRSSGSPGWGFLACRKIWERHCPRHSAVRCQPRNGSFWSNISSPAVLPQGLLFMWMLQVSYQHAGACCGVCLCVLGLVWECWCIEVVGNFAQHLLELASEPDRPRSSSLIFIHCGSQNLRPILSCGEGVDAGLMSLVG